MNAEGIIRSAPIIIPIARPLPQAGRMYQSLIFIIFFFMVCGGVWGLYFFIWLILLSFDLCFIMENKKSGEFNFLEAALVKRGLDEWSRRVLKSRGVGKHNGE